MKDLSTKSNDLGLWEDRRAAEDILKKKINLENILKRYTNLKNSAEFFGELLRLSGEDGELDGEIQTNLKRLMAEAEIFEVESMFGDTDDGNDCFLEVNAGVGGTDACDFTAMLLTMYRKWCRNNDFAVDVINLQSGDEAGITNAILRISGTNTFGWLKNESGIHRLVRMSPYNANGKRQTSFSSVWVYPVFSDEISIVVDENCLRIDTYRSSGAGGQHVNKTDSAVRITHLPTKITVSCQNQRSQHQNREEAMKLLKAKLYEQERQKRQREKEELDNKKTSIGWGHQVRNYIMNPYQLIKDLRSGYQVSNFEKMMNGEYLNDFIKSCIVSSRQNS